MSAQPRGVPLSRRSARPSVKLSPRATNRRTRTMTSILPSPRLRRMGSQVEFRSNGDTASGYLAVPASGSGPGLLVVQEWWGLVPQIKETCDRLAGEGFVALAPDLYHGDIAEHTEMDKANELMQSLPPDRAARDMGGAIDYLLAHDAVRGAKVGVIGFCMGGMLTLMSTGWQGDKGAVGSPFYGAPLGGRAPGWG